MTTEKQVLFENQRRILRKAPNFILRLIKVYSKAFYMDLKSLWIQLNVKAKGEIDNCESFPNEAEVTSNIVEYLSQSKISSQLIKITFYASSRRINNPNFNLEKFLQSLIKNCYDITKIEVLLAVDQDDDLNYFAKLKSKYDSQLRFIIIVNDVRFGYQGLHLYDRLLFQYISPTTRMLCDFSDDCYITLPNFDKELLAIDHLHSDNIYFIHTRVSNRQKYLGDVSKELLLLFWIMQAREPASYFPIISKRILDIAKEFARKNDKNNEWSPIANAWICDCYIDILGVYVQQMGMLRIHDLDMIKMGEGQVLAGHQRKLDQYQLTPNNRAFIKMLSLETQTYLKNLAKFIVSQSFISNESILDKGNENYFIKNI